MMREIELHGGPLDGRKHQLEDPLGMGCEPDAIALPLDACRARRAWYSRRGDGDYHFDRVEDVRAEESP